MKKLVILIGTTIALTSCREEAVIDNYGQTINPNSLIGTWNYTKRDIVSGTDGKTVLHSETPNTCESNTYNIFKSTGEFIEDLYSYNGGNCVGQMSSGSYIFNPSSGGLNIIKGGINYTKYVVKLTGNELEIMYDSGLDYNNDGVGDQYIVTYNK